MPIRQAVVGDTVGDPFKDTSGPSLNILLKLISVVALVIAPSIAISADSVKAYAEITAPTEMTRQVGSPNGTGGGRHGNRHYHIHHG